VNAGRTGGVPAFELIRRARVASLGLALEEYRHARTGARHFHLAADDANNAFMVAFKTVPQDSTGVAHILEHTALCGSRKYPVRDPFFMMLRRSLNTFMNAFTGSDTTAYPFASQNRKDFDNLLEVYLDAVFFPRLDALDFAQEGHRVEFETPDDSRSPLVYRGVVYNEMKGAMSAPVTQLWHELQARLFPTTTYHWNSGGDPEHIPDLSHAQLEEFHRRHYHPSNAVFFTYGDFPVEAHQGNFERWALRHFEARPNGLAIPDERRLGAPLREIVSYPVDEGDGVERRTHIVLGWLLGPSYRIEHSMNARLISSVLLADGASPLRRALECTELGAAPSELCGLEDSMKESVFMCGLEGSDPEHAAAVEDLILRVLDEVAEHGVPADQIEAALHQMELEQREVSGRLPYGLQLMNRILPATVHGGDVLAELDIDPVLARLREAIRDPEFIPGQVRELLIDNPHRVRLTMAPDVGLSARRRAAEQDRLRVLASELDAAERQRIIERAAALEQRQAAEDDPEILPRVGLADVPKDLRIPEGSEARCAGMPATWYARGTNGLVYQQIVIDLPELTPEETDALALLCSIYSEVGCGADDYLAMQARQTRTGRFGAAASVRSLVDDVQGIRGFFVLSGQGLARKAADIASLLKDLLLDIRFDETRRLRELISQERADAEASLTTRGHALAMLAAASGTAAIARLNHRWDGLMGIKQLKALDRTLGDAGEIERLGALLGAVHGKLCRAPRRVLLVGEDDHRALLTAAVDGAWADAPVVSQATSALNVAGDGGRVHEAWVTSTEVNFCARAYPTVNSVHEDAPALNVLGHFLRDGFLHRAIREQGGAYGAGASYDADCGSFRFYSYRDPRLEETLADFERSLDWLQSTDHGARRLEEAILGVIRDIDQPSSPAGEAIAAYYGELHGRDAAFRRRYRSLVLEVGTSDLTRVASTYLTPERANTAVIGSRAAVKQAESLGFEIKSI
jgi:Zn-dependent M16 (insulinase) family peptidase